MGTILKNVVRFTGLAIGVPTPLPHLLNVNGQPVAPRIGGANAAGFTFTATTTQLIATRTADAASGDVDVYVEYWHTIEAVIPQLTGLAGLTPLFFATGGGGAGESAFALLRFDWQTGTIEAQKNIASFNVVNVGIRDFQFTTPIPDINRAVITCSVEPEISDGQIVEPLQVFGGFFNANEVRVTVYPTQGAIFGNAIDPSDSAIRVHLRIDLADLVP